MNSTTVKIKGQNIMTGNLLGFFYILILKQVMRVLKLTKNLQKFTILND